MNGFQRPLVRVPHPPVYLLCDAKENPLSVCSLFGSPDMQYSAKLSMSFTAEIRVVYRRNLP